ncbi:MAG: hypothetical protein AAGK21_16865 [Bacteroidota bacterium]
MTLPLFSRRVLCGACALVLCLPATSAQEFGRIGDTQAQAPGYFFFARAGEPVVAVTAVGAVGASGLYLLGQGAHVGDLLALASGVQTAPASGEEPVVRLYRGGTVFYEAGLRSVFGPDADPPVLQDDDVVEVTSLVTSAPGYFVHNRPGVPPIVVTAAGAFGAPGRYVLDEGSTVGDLAALAGGVAGFVRDVDLEVTTTVRVYRGGGITFESPLAELYARPTPVLQPGDVVDLDVVTEQQSSFTLRDALSIITTIASVGLLVERLVNN